MSIETATALGMFAFGLPLIVAMIHPILTRSRGVDVYDAAAMEVDELLTERERSYTALADLDFDFECGKISDADYEALRTDLVHETALVLGQIDDMIAETRGGEPQKGRRSKPRAKPTVTIDDDAVEREISRFETSRGQPSKDQTK